MKKKVTFDDVSGMFNLPSYLSNMAVFNLSPAIECYLATVFPSTWYMITIGVVADEPGGYGPQVAVSRVPKW